MRRSWPPSSTSPGSSRSDAGLYCGAVGWVDADRAEGELNVAIRTFWVEGDQLCLGTGGAITWDSDRRRRVGRDRAQGQAPAGGGLARRRSARSAAAGRGGAMSERPHHGVVRRRLVAPDAVAVRLDDHGFTIGDGVFETLLVRAGHPTFWARHAARLARSLSVTGMAPVDEQLVAGAVRAVLDASGLTDARLRITVSSGPGPAGLRRGPRPSILVTAAPLATPGAGASGGAAPVDVVTFPWARNERSPLAGVKSTSYAEAAALQSRLDATGAGDALLGDTQGRLSEALTANVFVDARRPAPHPRHRLRVPRRHRARGPARGRPGRGGPHPARPPRRGPRGVPHVVGGGGAPDRARSTAGRCPWSDGPMAEAALGAFRGGRGRRDRRGRRRRGRRLGAG